MFTLEELELMAYMLNEMVYMEDANYSSPADKKQTELIEKVEGLVENLRIADVVVPTDKEGTLPANKFRRWDISRGDGDAVQDAV